MSIVTNGHFAINKPFKDANRPKYIRKEVVEGKCIICNKSWRSSVPFRKYCDKVPGKVACREVNYNRKHKPWLREEVKIRMRPYVRAYMQRNKEKVYEQNRKWFKENGGQAAYMRAWRERRLKRVII